MTVQSTEHPKHYDDLFSQIAADCCHKWFKDPSEGIIDILVYPVVGITTDQLQTLIKLEWPENQSSWQGMLAAADIHGMRFIDFTSHVQVNTEGLRLSLPTEVIRELEFDGPALLVAIPKDCASFDNPVSIVIPLLRLHRGNAIAWGTPIRLRYNGKTHDQWIAQSIGKPYSSNTDGPFDSPKMAKNIAEALSKLLTHNDLIKARASFALELFTKANESIRDSLRVRIFQYWSAIETLCDTNKTDELLKYLFNGNQDSAQDNKKNLFKETRVLRHNVTHKGHDPSACPHTLERFLQVVFLDMLRKILCLDYEGYAEQFINRHGVSWFKEKYKKI